MAKMDSQNHLQMSSISPQQSRDSVEFSENVAPGSVEIAQTNLCSDQEITATQSIALTESNFSKVYDVLSEVRDMWFNIGLQLGVTTVILKGIEENYRESLNALREVLIKCKGTELKDLIEALHKPTVDQPVCAKRLEDLVLKELQHDEKSSADCHSTDVKDR